MKRMQERIKRLRDLRRKQRKKPNCPECNTPMKRKGRGKFRYWKCPLCKTKILWDGSIRPNIFKDDKVAHDAQAKLERRELSKRKFIKWAKKNKYYPLRFIEWAGEIIDLEQYDKDGIPLKEKEKLKKEKESLKKKKKKTKKKRKRNVS